MPPGQRRRRLRQVAATGLLLIVALGLLLRGYGQPDSTDRTVRSIYQEALEQHRQRCVAEASRLYEKVLEKQVPTQPTSEEMKRVLRLAPRLFTTPNEFFELEDVVAILHPDRPLIAYHLFWDDDIDFPADNDPTDHEITWVSYDPDTGRIADVYGYFHGQILRVSASTEKRPRVDVEWGKHGSLPRGALRTSDAARATLYKNWKTLREEGTRRAGHPLARNWPTAFSGNWQAYRDFSEEVDPRGLLEQRQLVAVSRWANAVIDRQMLRYNFAAKPAWPDE